MNAIENRYNVKTYRFDDAADAVAARQTTVREGVGISLVGGRRGKAYETMVSQTEFVLGKMRERHNEWIQEKVAKVLPYLVDSQQMGKQTEQEAREKLEKAFLGGARLAVVQEYRVRKKKWEEVLFEERVKEPTKPKDGLVFLKTLATPGYDDERVVQSEQRKQRTALEKKLLEWVTKPEMIEQILVGYTSSFYRTLTVCERLSVPGSMALNLAQYRPTAAVTLMELRRDPQYADVHTPVLAEAVYHGASNPRLYLNRYRTDLDALLSDRHYQNVPESVLAFSVRAAKGASTARTRYVDAYGLRDLGILFMRSNVRGAAIQDGFLTKEEVDDLSHYFRTGQQRPSKEMWERFQQAVARYYKEKPQESS